MSVYTVGIQNPDPQIRTIWQSEPFRRSVFERFGIWTFGIWASVRNGSDFKPFPFGFRAIPTGRSMSERSNCGWFEIRTKKWFGLTNGPDFGVRISDDHCISILTISTLLHLQEDIPLLVTLPASFANAFACPPLTKEQLAYPSQTSDDDLMRIHSAMQLLPQEEGNLTIPLLAYRTGRIPGNNNQNNQSSS